MTNKKEIVSNEEFSVIFGGNDSIDHELLFKLMSSVKILLKESSRATDIDSSLRLEIKATKEGSVDFCLNLIVEQMPSLIVASTPFAHNYASEVIRRVIEWFRFKGNINININFNFNILSPTNHYNGTVDNSVSNIFNNLSKEDRESISFVSKDDSIEIPRSKFGAMATPIINIPKNKRRIYIKLGIRKPDLLEDSKWGFKVPVYFKERFNFDKDSINAKVKDPVFLMKVRNGMKINAGTEIYCELQISDKVSKDGEITQEYTVLKVMDDPSQGELF